MDDIQTALTAIEEGTYGKCIECGEEIPLARLEAVPTTLICVEHAPKEVDQSIRPVEESLLNSSTDQPVNNEDPLLRDYANSFEELEEVGSSDYHRLINCKDEVLLRFVNLRSVFLYIIRKYIKFLHSNCLAPPHLPVGAVIGASAFLVVN